MVKPAEGDERVLAAAQQIMKSLGTSKNMKEDMMFILSNLGSRFADIGDVLSSGTGKGGLEEQLEAAEEVIMGWDADSGAKAQAFLFSEGYMDEATAYLAAVDDVVRAVEELGSAEDGGEVLERAESVLQMAMARLEDEFRHVLLSNAVVFDADAVYESMHRLSNSFQLDSPHSVEFENGEDDGIQAPMSVSVELVNPVGVDDLKDIADRMIRAGYEKELCQVYTSFRREAMDEYLTLLGVEKLGIEEVQKIEWSALDEKMKRWGQAVKVAVKVVLTGEKRLCEQVFSGSNMIERICFSEISKGCVMQLITFAEAIAVGRRASEKLFRILDMYDALSDVLQDLRVLLCDDMREFICSEVEVILGSLGDAAKGTFAEFESAVKGEKSRKPTLGGEIHPLTRYVMNYVKLLVDYSDTLNRLFDDVSHGQKGSPVAYNDGSDSRIGDGSPLAHRLLLILSSLEANLEEKSKLYDDKALRYVFMMNNIHYIVQKVKDSELGKLVGDQWIRTHRGRIRQCATCYLRASWSKVLACIKEDGSSGAASSSAFKLALKEKFKNFNLCFEEIYKIQSAWKVPDPQLREEMRISISEKVIPAYRSFMGRYRHQVESGRNAGKYVKYTADDLENYLLDFFEGTPGTLNHPRRKTVG
uniref:Exocyst subunit Exo70 family protein n=1 Tax=Kalanchoe fedtschenkoi TaxID=63787 RepID=A0A7N0U8X3_KALFE